MLVCYFHRTCQRLYNVHERGVELGGSLSPRLAIVDRVNEIFPTARHVILECFVYNLSL